MKSVLTLSFTLFLILHIFYGCKKEYDYPPLKEVNDGGRISIQTLKNRLIAPLNYYRFKGGDTNLYCTVVSDELSGNFYQQVFVRDDFGSAIQLNLKESGGLYTGDKIRINLNNTYIISANSMIYLDSLDVVKSVVKLSSGNTVIPKLVTYEEVMSYSANPTNSASLQSQLVELSGMEFKTNTLVPTFADAIGKTSVNQTITSCDVFKSLTVRTSGRSNFAGKLLPKGNGRIVGIISQYNATMQLNIRDFNDVKMDGTPCAAPINTVTQGIILLKDFNDNSITSGGWTSYTITNGAVNWSIGTSSLTATPYAKISGYQNGNTHSENWLISSMMNLTSAKDPILNFRSAAKFSGTVLDVLISTNYSSGDPSLANWTSLSPNYLLSPSSSDYLWTNSGNVSLAAFKSSATRLAFKYKSTTSGATSYQLDDIVIREKP